MEMKLLTVKEVMEITGFKQSKCYQIIQKLNEELEKKGFITFNGKVPEGYLNERLFPK